MTTRAFRILSAASKQGLLRDWTPERLLEHARRSSGDPLEVATNETRLPREAFYRALAEANGLRFLRPDQLVVEAALLEGLPARLLQRKQVLPLERVEGSVLVATSDPDDESTVQTLQRLIQGRLILAVAEPQAIASALRRVLPQEASAGPRSDFDAVAFLDDLLNQAWLRRASDVHLDPQAEGLVLRLRVDGQLVATGAVLGAEDAAALTSRVKVLGGLDIAERRGPQDGSFSYTPRGEEGRALDIRVATIPTRMGERATMRLLGAEADELSMERLGFHERDLTRLRRALTQPHGMVLLTGPTGSGKTTTLYAALRELASPERNVMTVEDPVERVIPGTAQVPVDRAGKVTFAHALRSLLRHDPDVMMVGEIRDGETADVAVKAAMTGHMVLSSLHTNRAAGAPARLIDLGCESFLVASVLRAVIAQRLVRRLCPECRAEREVGFEALQQLGAPLPGEGPYRIYEPAGCPKCVGTGYVGRLALMEGLWTEDEAIGAAISEGASELELRRLSRGVGCTIVEDGLAKVLAGRTSVAEAMRARI